MVEEIVLKSACIINNRDYLDYLSALGPTIAAFFAFFVALRQTRISKQQKNLELLKLRLKHKQNFISILSKLMKTAISVNETNISESQSNILANISLLIDVVSEGKYLFNEEVFENENKILFAFHNFCDTLNNSNFNEIENKKKLFNNFINDIDKIKNLQDKILKETQI